MKSRFNKINWLSRAVYCDVKLNDSATRLPIIVTRRLYNEGPAEGVRVAAAPTAALTDSWGRRHNYLRISLTERCNLRCQYCMPAEGVELSRRAALLTRAELATLVRVLAAAGVDKLRLTGGEPTLRADLADIIRELSAVPGIRGVSMTTNGLVLTRRLPGLQRAGLAALNVSLDSLQAARYERMARRPGLARVLAGVDLALQLGVPVKINTVLMKGFNYDEICDFVEYTKHREVEIRFIEFMPFMGNKWDDSQMIPYRTALRAVQTRHPGLEPALPRPNDTARVWRVPGYAGSVGFISSMTQHFCSSCNRLRLTADGNLKVCLFGAAEVSLRDALRGGAGADELLTLVRHALSNKKPSHADVPSAGRLQRRAYSTRAGGEGGEGGPFSHLDAGGAARMVDVGDKAVTRRVAVAECRLQVGARLLRLLRDARLPKGDALCVARVAGALAAKRTADLIPLCHPLPLELARVTVHVPRGESEAGGALRVRCEVRVTARTGAEMEALTGCAVAALALYDMCKSVDKDMCVTDLRLVRKQGGRSDLPAPAPAPTPAPAPAGEDAPQDQYAPTNVVFF